jgi:hypothetical protein
MESKREIGRVVRQSIMIQPLRYYRDPKDPQKRIRGEPGTGHISISYNEEYKD